MRVIFIGQKGLPAKTGGVEKYVENLALNLVNKGQEVFVFSRRNYSHKLKEYKGVRIVPVGNLPGKNFEAITNTLFACLKLIFKRVDIIHFQSIGPASLMWLVKIIKPRTPIVFTFHCRDYYHQKWGRFARLYLRWGEKIGCRLANQIVTISKELNSYTLKTYNRNANYIPNGASLHEKVPVREIRRFGLEEGNYLVSISRLIRHKGIHHLIKAYNNLQTDKKLVIVGDGSYTNDYVQELHELAADNPNIIFTGNQTGRTLAELYSNAYAFVQPSESEGLSIALLEAMSYGQVCLASDISANQEALGEAGYFFKDRDVNDLQAKLEYLLENPEAIKSFSQKALERVRKEYNWNDIADQMIKVYKQVSEKNK